MKTRKRKYQNMWLPLQRTPAAVSNVLSATFDIFRDQLHIYVELARYPHIMISCPPALMVRVGSFLQDSIVWVNFWYVCHYCLHFPPEHVNNAQPRNPSPYTICRPLAIVVSGPSYLGRCSGCLLPNTHFSTSSYIHKYA